MLLTPSVTGFRVLEVRASRLAVPACCHTTHGDEHVADDIAGGEPGSTWRS